MGDLIERLRDKIQQRIVVSKTGCWEWPGSNVRGYGQVWCPETKRTHLTHRVMVEASGRNIPPGLLVDHLCRNHRCCNPDHLEVVTHQENVKRGMAGPQRRINATFITHCPRGHEYTDHNTRIGSKGERNCRECDKARGKRWRAARAILSRPQQGPSDATKRMEQTLGAKFKGSDNG